MKIELSTFLLFYEGHQPIFSFLQATIKPQLDRKAVDCQNAAKQDLHETEKIHFLKSELIHGVQKNLFRKKPKIPQIFKNSIIQLLIRKSEVNAEQHGKNRHVFRVNVNATMTISMLTLLKKPRCFFTITMTKKMNKV